MVRPAKDEYCVGVAQPIDLWSHIYRQPRDYGDDQQQRRPIPARVGSDAGGVSRSSF